jgi:predicted membrane protein
MHERRWECRVINTHFILGLLIVLAGLVALADSLFPEIDISVWDYWPLVFVVIGIPKIFRPIDWHEFINGFLWILVGALLILSNLDIIKFTWKQIWPLLLIIAGIGMLKHAFFGIRKAGEDVDTLNLTMLMGGGEYKYTSKKMRGGNITAVMGGGELDFRDADIDGDTMVLNIFALMGGVDIKVPEDWDVIIDGAPILGGLSNKTVSAVDNGKSTTKKLRKKLIIKGTAIMGGVEVKN